MRSASISCSILLAALSLAVPPGNVGLAAQLPPILGMNHLAGRCESVPVLDGPMRTVYGALAEPGDPDAVHGALLALQDSLSQRLEAEPGAAEDRYLLAAVLGARSEVSSGRERLAFAGAMEVEARRVLADRPNHPGAQHLVGRLHAAVRRLSGFKRFAARTLFGGEAVDGASWESARVFLEAAESGAPCIPDHHYELARLYLDLGEDGLAVREVRHTLELAGLREEYGPVGRKALRLLDREARGGLRDPGG